MSRPVEALLERARARLERAKPWAIPKPGSSTRPSQPVHSSSSATRTPITRTRPALDFSSSSSQSSSCIRARLALQRSETETLARSRAARARADARKKPVDMPKPANSPKALSTRQRRNVPSPESILMASLWPAPASGPVDKPKPVNPLKASSTRQRRNVHSPESLLLAGVAPARSQVEKPKPALKSVVTSTKQPRRVHWPESPLLASTAPASSSSSSGRRSPTIAPPPLPQPTPARQDAPVKPLISILRKPGSTCPVKRARFGDEHCDKEQQVVRKEVYTVKRWIGIVQFTEPGSWIFENGRPLCGVGPAIHCYPDPRRIVNGQLVSWTLIPGTTDEYDYVFGSSRMSSANSSFGQRIGFCHKDCPNAGCNRYPQVHANCNADPIEYLRMPDWKMDDVFRPEIQPIYETYKDDW